jgi:hypothetical protein
MLNESIKIAQAFEQLGSWEAVQDEILEQDILQKGKTATIRRTFRELKKRLEQLTPDQLDYLLDANTAGQRLLLFLGVCRLYPFIGEFTVEVLRNKVTMFEHQLLESDYQRYFQNKAALHDALEGSTELTQKKIRSRLFRILEEAGLINNIKEKWITPPMVTPGLARPLIEEDPNLLKYWLVSDLDIKNLIKQYDDAAL